MRKSFGIFILWICCQAISSQSYKEDVLFDILKREVDYYYSHLSQDSIPVSFLSLNVSDEKHLTITSDMGYSSFTENSSRKLYPTIRFGGNFKKRQLSRENDWMQIFVGREQIDLPLADDSLTIKEVIWRTLSKNYVDAVEALYKNEKKDSVQNEVDKAEPEKFFESPLPEHKIDKEKWTALLNTITQIQKESILATCKASLSFQTRRNYIVNSDGTEIVQNRRTFWIWLQASVKDQKGIECPLDREFFAYDESELPDENTLCQTMVDLIARADALSKAPLAEAYSGPVLFSGEAGGVFFHEVIGHRLERDDSEFKPMMGKNVLPKDISVTCDPTIKDKFGTPLDGYYLYDDEGTKAQKVECIKDGIMKNFLHVIPQKKEDAPSNGHGRAAFGEKPIPRQSNLIVETSSPYTEQQLREMLVQQLKEDDKEYGYYIRTVSNGWTTTSNSTNRVSSFNVVPIETYKIYADGRPDSLVRGVSFIGTPLVAFSNIKAAGSKPEIINGKCGSRSGWLPVSITSPMIYVSQIETQCVRNTKDIRPSILPCPEFVQKGQLIGMNTDSVIFRAMADEMKRSQDSLKATDGTKPYFIDYVIRRQASAKIESAWGVCKRICLAGIKNAGIADVVVGNKMRTSYSGTSYGEPFTLPDEISYNHIRRELWNMTSKQFESATHDYVSKNRKRLQEFIDDSIPEWQEQPANIVIERSALESYEEDTQKMKALADTLSAVFKRYPTLINPRVIIEHEGADYYRVTSDGLRMRTPQKKISISIRVEIPTTEGKTFSGGDYLSAYDMNELPPTDSLLVFVERCAIRCAKQEDLLCPKVREYVGPVLYEDYSAKLALIDEHSMANNISTYISSWLNLSSREYDKSYKKIGQKVISSNLSVWQLGNDSVYNGRRLFRYHKYDADGIRPATIELIRDGVLVNQLSGRIPSPNSLKSTGNEWLRDEWKYTNHITHFQNGIIRITSNNTMNHTKLVKNLRKLAKKQHLEYAYILKGGRVNRINVKTGKQEELRLNCWDGLSKLELMGEVMASKENAADWENSIIYPKAILLPVADLTFKDIECSPNSERFKELRH